MKKFCEDHIKCQEDTEETWTCTAHLDSGQAFRCPYKESDIKFVPSHKKDMPIKANGYPCIDYRPILKKKDKINPDQCGSGRHVGRNYPEDYFG